jgi:hypothetical protein
MEPKGKFRREFFKLLGEDNTAGGALGGSAGLEGGSIGNTDTYAPGDSRIPKSIFGGTLTRAGVTKCKKCKKGKKCVACKKTEEEEKND